VPALKFNRDAMARWYAKQHLTTDPGIESVHYLPTNASQREIRFIEVNTLLADRTDDVLEPIDFGVDRGMDSEHKLLLLDVTPEQWERISSRDLRLPGNWTLDGVESFP
jgi:hypothetical protein